jgi:RNA polymerase sigma factor (sigma-70 family)
MEAKIESRSGPNRTGDEFARAVRGDASAFAAFLVRFEKRIGRLVRMLAPRGDAEDAFQEVCLRLLARGHTYDPYRPLEPWIDTVVRHVCADAGRRRARLSRERSLSSPAEQAVAAPTATPEPWIVDAMRSHLGEIEGPRREALKLVLTHGFTQREAAARLRVPPGTVASWIARSVRTIRARLSGKAKS